MRRPPLISYLCFNRLGNTAVTLPMLLRVRDDFELILIDNGSRDDTWQFINDIKDPRIKHIKQFEENIGVVHGLNYCLSMRKDDQDWINYEYDFRIHDMNFITSFQDIYKEFPDMGGISATIFPSQTDDVIPGELEKDPKRLIVRNEKRIYKDYIMGFCAFLPYETLNKLMYYDEVHCFADVELNLRIRSIEKFTGYALDIHCSHITFEGFCDTCTAYHGYCESYNKYREPKCTKYYSRIVSKVTDEIGMWAKYAVMREDADERGVFPDSKKLSIFGTEEMDEKDKNKSMHNMELFKTFSANFRDEVDLKDKEREDAEAKRGE